MNLVVRLHRGQDLLKELNALARRQDLAAGYVACCVGCVSRARIRDASGVDVRELNEDMEIVSLTGTLSAARTHLHIAFSKRDLSTVGGHLLEGCIVNTTAEIVVCPLDGYRFGSTFDEETGYDELCIEKENASFLS